MRSLLKLRMMFRSLFLRNRTEADLEDEMRDHLEREIECNMRRGMSREEAEFAARRLIGPVALYKEECRDARGLIAFENFRRDLRYALQTLRRTPLFTAAALLTLTLGIGANTAIFTFVENVVLRSLPVHDPQRVVSLNWGGMVNMSYPNYADFRDRTSAFSNLVACRYNLVNLGIQPRQSALVWGYEATGNYFDMLGIQPALGRFFGPDEDNVPGAHPVLVISYTYWQNHFHGDPGVIGRSVKINGYPFTIIGVAPRSFGGTELITSSDFWVPMSMELEIEPGNDWLHARSAQNVWVVGRLRPGVTHARAEADLDRIARQLARAYPDQLNPKATFRLSLPGLIGNTLRGPITTFGIVLMSIAGAGLLLACVNLAGMLLARTSDRSREIGIRLALGAGKFHLLRQLMTESLILALAGGLLGFLFAAEACRLFSDWHPEFGLPINTALHPNLQVLCFTIGVAFSTTMLFGLTPALHAIRTDLLSGLKNEPVAIRFRGWSVRDILVVGQIAISVILIISSVLVVRSLQHALTLNLGFKPEGAVSIAFDQRLKGYTPEGSRHFDIKLLAKASAQPGMQSVAIISNFPLHLDHENNTAISRGDRAVPSFSQLHAAVVYSISPGYLKTAGTTLLRGRDFNDHDREGAPNVVIVNQALADVLFPGENAIGKRLRMTMSSSDKGDEIVGVVETGKYESIGEDPHPAVFLPIEQTGTDWTTLVARSSLPDTRAIELLRKTVLDLNPELSISDAGTLESQLALPLFPARVAASILGIFGVLAMILAATGLFALMAYAVSRRTKEIGIRMALGARSRQVLSSVFGRTAVLCAIGISIGTAATLFAGRMLSSILYGISPRDPATYAAALFLIVAVSLLASWYPAMHAVGINPARAIRDE